MTIFYIDPAATTALVSSITAIAAAVGAYFVITARKAKKKLKKIIKTDETKNKEVEEDLVINTKLTATEEKLIEENKELILASIDSSKDKTNADKLATYEKLDKIQSKKGK